MIYNDYIRLITKALTFKTVSTDPGYKGEILAFVEWLTQLLKDNGFKVTTFKGSKTNPIIFASYILDKTKKQYCFTGTMTFSPQTKQMAGIQIHLS